MMRLLLSKRKPARRDEGDHPDEDRCPFYFPIFCDRAGGRCGIFARVLLRKAVVGGSLDRTCHHGHPRIDDVTATMQTKPKLPKPVKKCNEAGVTSTDSIAASNPVCTSLVSDVQEDIDFGNSDEDCVSALANTLVTFSQVRQRRNLLKNVSTLKIPKQS
jgi:hypothetical protein